MVFRVFVEVDKKGHCFVKTLKQSSPRLGFSSDLCAALRLHAKTAILCSRSFSTVRQMVRLFLFRLGSLLGLFALLVWEAFYRPNGDNFAGKHNKKTKITYQYFVFIGHPGSTNNLINWFSPFLQEIISNAKMHTVSRKIFGRYVSMYFTIAHMNTRPPFYSLIFSSSLINEAILL